MRPVTESLKLTLLETKEQYFFYRPLVLDRRILAADAEADVLVEAITPENMTKPSNARTHAAPEYGRFRFKKNSNSLHFQQRF